MQNDHIAVQIEAAQALAQLVNHQEEHVKQVIRPQLPQLIGAFFKAVADIGSEEILGALNTLLHNFGEEITPYAVNLAEQFSQFFVKLGE